jgi:general secretion pathway protein A
MYRRFYNLSRYPFELSPDPYFFYASPGHKEVLLNLIYGIQRRKGFIAVSGEVGTGKTLLIHCLSELLRRLEVPFACVKNPHLSSAEFIQSVLEQFKLPFRGASKGDGIAGLGKLLMDQYRRGQTCVLIVDEAQLLSWKMLEEIRLLGNLETAQQKLLQIILVGQPELDTKIDSPSCLQLKQRITLRCHLAPLSEEETRKCIVNRLELAGANSSAQSIFSPEAIAAIYRYSRGIPRVVNAIAENALLVGYSCEARCIGVDLIEEVSSTLHLSSLECRLAV